MPALLQLAKIERLRPDNFTGSFPGLPALKSQNLD
jgi:hypothetical protein